jgi:hypothetical protein
LGSRRRDGRKLTVCTLGTQPKAGQPAYVWLTQALYLSFSFLKMRSLAETVLQFISPELLLTAAFCSTEPTVPSAPSLGTWALALVRNFEAVQEVSVYIIASFKAWYWDQICECIPETPTTGTQCKDWTVATLTPSWQRLHLPDLSEMGHFVGTPPSAGTWQVLTGASLEMAFVVYPDGTFPSQLLEIDTGIGAGATHSDALNPAYAYYGVQARSIGGASSGTATIRFCYTGTSDPTPVYIPPPPDIPPEVPDPPTVHICTSFDEVCAAINELRLEMEGLFAALPGPRTPAGRTGWKYGTVRAGLTGHGSYAAAGILGVLVECAVPSVWGRTTETPFRSIPNLGGVQFGVGGVPDDKRQVHYAHENFLDPPEFVDSVFWNFGPGISATITDIVPDTAAV